MWSILCVTRKTINCKWVKTSQGAVLVGRWCCSHLLKEFSSWHYNVGFYCNQFNLCLDCCEVISGNTPFMLQSYRPRELVRIWLVSALPDDCAMNLMTGSSPSFVSCSCGAALVAGMPLCAVPVHSGRWGAGGGDGVQETKRRRLAPNSRHEPLLERDQTQVPQYPVRGHSQRCSLYQFGGMDAFRAKVQQQVPVLRNLRSFILLQQ